MRQPGNKPRQRYLAYVLLGDRRVPSRFTAAAYNEPTAAARDRGLRASTAARAVGVPLQFTRKPAQLCRACAYPLSPAAVRDRLRSATVGREAVGRPVGRGCVLGPAQSQAADERPGAFGLTAFRTACASRTAAAAPSLSACLPVRPRARSGSGGGGRNQPEGTEPQAADDGDAPVANVRHGRLPSP